MTDYDADEPVSPMKLGNKNSSILTDRLLAGTGVALACAAGLFPWYVFFNEEKFGIRTAGWENTRDLPEGPGRNVFSVSPLALVDDDKESSPEVRETMVDPVVTATVSQLGEEDKANGQVMPEQPFPGRSGFKLLHVANGRALIEDESGMYMVRVGSILPDNSRVATLEQRDGKWVIITSAGEIYENN
ncbi:flagellar protein [Rhizobium sp. RU36D]|uniref:flagellar protein n=1 Tax=Rhizobium sp. RU36D TaxID=1907415 RepID=UPI0009D88DF8|nr:flagellar protein [Rhizobium sp. RU36D]SMC85035.1 hypothetical protein SAMN05880593_10884 [Rhizobium sp. RU36D]